MEGHRAWIALNLEHLRHNVAALQALLPPGCRLMPVVKANAYGHGAVPIARALSRLGIRSFCVATAEEGAELRRHHIPGDILILGFTPVEELRHHDVQVIQKHREASNDNQTGNRDAHRGKGHKAMLEDRLCALADEKAEIIVLHSCNTRPFRR